MELSLPRAWDKSLVQELRFHKMQEAAKKKETKQRNKKKALGVIKWGPLGCSRYAVFCLSYRIFNKFEQMRLVSPVVHLNLPTTGKILGFGFPGSSAGKASACSAGDLGSVPGLGTSPREGNSYPLQYSGLENSVDCIVHGVVKS